MIVDILKTLMTYTYMSFISNIKAFGVLQFYKIVKRIQIFLIFLSCSVVGRRRYAQQAVVRGNRKGHRKKEKGKVSFNAATCKCTKP